MPLALLSYQFCENTQPEEWTWMGGPASGDRLDQRTWCDEEIGNAGEVDSSGGRWPFASAPDLRS
jgi:hypothetical protein